MNNEPIVAAAEVPPAIRTQLENMATVFQTNMPADSSTGEVSFSYEGYRLVVSLNGNNRFVKAN